MNQLACVACATAIALVPRVSAAGPLCRIAELEFAAAEPASAEPMYAPPQIVAWIEDAAGSYVGTVFITQRTGTYGLGNRPGLVELNSGPMWPYGRRTAVFPVWAHKHGIEFPEVVFQDGYEDGLSHDMDLCSQDYAYCQPYFRSDPEWAQADAGTCATALPRTDKGVLGAGTSRYPPRNDVLPAAGDSASVAMYEALNPFDSVSRATPRAGERQVIGWQLPDEAPNGNYVMWIEVSREFDHNAVYSVGARPSPMVPFGDYGEAYRGQPSVLYKIPFGMSNVEQIATTLDYAGYGEPDGKDGIIRDPDDTITNGIPGSGAGRLQVLADGDTLYRARVRTFEEDDTLPPGAIREPRVVGITHNAATLELVAPGDDGTVGRVHSYDIRFKLGGDITLEEFASLPRLRGEAPVADAGARIQIPFDKLIWETEYTIAIQAIDNCRNTGPLSVLSFRTADRPLGEVDACFIATAAYGSAMAADVELLRQFRDLALQRTVLGELAVEAYYTFSPALAGVIGESELLRATARWMLEPIVTTVRGVLRRP